MSRKVWYGGQFNWNDLEPVAFVELVRAGKRTIRKLQPIGKRKKTEGQITHLD